MMETSRRGFFAGMSAIWALASRRATVDPKTLSPPAPDGSEVIAYIANDFNIETAKEGTSAWLQMVAAAKVDDDGARLIRGHGISHVAKIGTGRARLYFSGKVSSLAVIDSFINVCPTKDGMVAALTKTDRSYVEVVTTKIADGYPEDTGFFLVVHAVMKA